VNVALMEGVAESLVAKMYCFSSELMNLLTTGVPCGGRLVGGGCSGLRSRIMLRPLGLSSLLLGSCSSLLLIP